MATHYSKATLLGHPIHPMLIAFPITFFSTTLVAFIVYAVGGDVTWFHIGYWANVAGIVGALLAAVPGFIDWAIGIPQGSQAKRVGLLHMGLNLTVVGIFIVNAVLLSAQRAEATPAATLPVVLSLIGVLGLLASGYLGWSLVQTYHVGIDLTREQERIDPHAPFPPGSAAK
jgi:uncharacterized membrane protein